MVKILSVHHFLNEDIQSLGKGSSYTICSAYDNLLLVAGEHRIDAYDLKNGPVIRHSFPTIDYVQQIIYSNIGNYVCTLEKKSEEEGGEQTCVRVYFRWDAYNEDKPMKARIAGMVSPRGENDSEILEMLEVPAKALVASIAVCKKTGNLCLSSGPFIHVYKFCEKILSTSKLNYYDFECILETEISFYIEEIIIAEDIIGCLCDTEVQILQIVVDSSKKSQSKNKVELNIEAVEAPKQDLVEKKCNKFFKRSKQPDKVLSLEENNGPDYCQYLRKEKENCVRDEIDQFMNMEEMRWAATLAGSTGINNNNYLLFPSLIGGHWNCRLPIRNEVSVDISKAFSATSQSPSAYAQNFTQIILLHKKLDEMGNSLSPFSNLQIIQYFGEKQGTVPESVKGHPLMDSNGDTYRPRKGTTVFFAGLMDGNFFHICEDGQVMSEAMYVFTADVIKVSLESHIVHVMTKTGLESYMIRPHPCILDSVPGGYIKIPLSFNKAVNVIGLRPFRNVQSVAATRDFLAVVFHEIKDGDNTLSLCSLKLQSPTELYSEVVRISSNHPDLSPTNSLELLLEGYLALLTAANSADESSSIDYSVHTRHARELLVKYFLRENSVEFWKEAVKFFLSTGCVLSDFLKGLSDDIPGKEFFLKQILLHKDAPILEGNEIEEVIMLCNSLAPNSFANIILRSKCLSEYRGTKVLSCIGNETDTTNTEEVVAIIFTCVDTISSEKMVEYFDRVNKQELISTLEGNIHLLLNHEKDNIELTDLSKFMVKYKNEIFNEVAANCVYKLCLGLDSITTSLTSSFPIYSCDMECNTNYIKLRDFIEMYYKLYGSRTKSVAQNDHKQSVSMMISLYLASLMGAFNHQDTYAKSCKRAENFEIYGTRQSYLNMLPPFNGAIPTECTSREVKGPGASTEKCVCPSCSVDLLLLQSLLLSNYPSDSDRNTVVTFAKSNSSYSFANTLIIIADKSIRIDAIVKQYPTALPQYIKDTCKSTADWKQAIQQIIKSCDEFERSSIEGDSTLKRVVDDVLFEAAKTMSLEEFVDAVPPEKYESCENQIDLCHRCSLANRLQEIMDQFSNAYLNSNKSSRT